MATFPELDYSSIRYVFSPDANRTDFSSKNTRQRKIMSNNDDEFSVTLRLNNSELETLEDFFVDEISNGADVFTGPYWTSDVVTNGDIQVKEGTYSAQYLTNDFWEVSYTFNARERNLEFEQGLYETVEYISGFDGFCEIIEATEQAVNYNSL